MIFMIIGKKVSVLFLGGLMFILFQLSSCQQIQGFPITNQSEIVPPTAVSPPLPIEIKLAWFYKPPFNGLIDPLVKNFDIFILTHKDENERDRLQALGVDSPILQYLQLIEIDKPSSCDEEPNGNQVAYQANVFCEISVQHPDWFLLDQYGNRIQNQDGTYYYMDPGNPGYREFWLKNAREMQEQFGWDGVFIDNVEASLSKLHSQGIYPANYPDDLSYQNAIYDFLAYLRLNYFGSPGHPVFANIISKKDDTVWLRYLQQLDGAMIEAFAVGWSSDYRTPKDWESQMELIEKALSQGKMLILVSQGTQTDTTRQQFAFASYLLVTNGNAAFRYTNYDNYRYAWLYNNYSVDLGSALSSRYRQGQSWRRDFTNGYVVVNPVMHNSLITINP
jgi:hypothetical protein